MCGRFGLITDSGALSLTLGVTSLPAVPLRYNIAPTQPVLAVRREAGERRPSWLRWGLVPHWARDSSGAAKMINARAETLFDKAAFRDAARQRRCLIPASGFFEWSGGRGQKKPHYITASDASLLIFAGLWERWSSPEAAPLETCTIVTTAAWGGLTTLHHRAPFLLRPEDFDAWLEGGAALPAPWHRDLTWRPVSTRVNDVRHDDPTVLAPPLQGELFG